MTNAKRTMEKISNERSEFIVIGLTGRTGSGCSSVAQMLAQEDFYIPESSPMYESAVEKRKYNVLRKFYAKNHQPFICIQVRTILTYKILELNFDKFIDLLCGVSYAERADVEDKLNEFKSSYNNAYKKVIEFNEMPEKNEAEKQLKKDQAWDLFFGFLPRFSNEIKDFLQKNIEEGAYTDLYQQVGDHIRASGSANQHVFSKGKVFTIPVIINQLIKVIRGRNELKDSARIIIDAIRNPYEASYFHNRYSAFYLFSINTPNEERLSHLRRSHKFSEIQINKLDEKEYPRRLDGEKIFVSQDIQKCIESADIHINNPDRDEENRTALASQLVWYVSLILHPGLVTPTPIERCMQLAYTAKLSSGCISRKVGAVVTDSSYSIKSVGWNCTPYGQMPCVLRDANELINEPIELVYSEYERNDEAFRRVLKSTFKPILTSALVKGRTIPYCFKDLQNRVEGEKNQVHTRSLHAEENAFLQISKYGGAGINDGVLFTTASPCELCSKKACQLGINKIYYIDPYPGISKEHIMSSNINATPELILFRGAIGKAYHKVYHPIMAEKDELQLLTGYVYADGDNKDKKDIKIKQLEAEIVKLKGQQTT